MPQAAVRKERLLEFYAQGISSKILPRSASPDTTNSRIFLLNANNFRDAARVARVELSVNLTELRALFRRVSQRTWSR